MAKFKKNTHLSLSISLSLYLSNCRCTLIFPKGCLSFFAKTVWVMEFRKECFVNLKICACDRKYAKCSKADAHDKIGFQYISISVYIVRSHSRIQRGDRGIPPEKAQLSNTGPDPLKFSKLPCQHSTLGHYLHASETPFKGVSLTGR